MSRVFLALLFVGCTSVNALREADTIDDAGCLIPPANVAVMPLGDSISWGGVTHGEPAQGAYRRPLWQTARAAGVTVRFVGSLADPYPFWPALGSHDHDAHDGYSCTELLYGRVATSLGSPGLRAGQWVAEMAPQFVFTECGSNDLRKIPYCCTVSQLLGIASAMVAVADEVHAQAPTARVWMMSLPPNYAWRKTNFVATINGALPALLAARPWLGFINLTALLVVINGGVLITDYVDQDDGLHPTAQGYAKISAAVWSATHGLQP